MQGGWDLPMPKKVRTPDEPSEAGGKLKDLYTLPEVAKVLGIARKTLARYLKSSDCALNVSLNVTGKRRGERITGEHLKAYIESCRESQDLPGSVTTGSRS